MVSAQAGIEQVNALDRFRTLVADDDALQMELALADRRETFVAAACAAARARGLALGPEDLAPIFERDPLGLQPREPPVDRGPHWPSPDWLPAAVNGGADGTIGVDWAHFAGARLGEPFFTGSARRAWARPLNQLIRLRTSLDDFIAGNAPGTALAPDGLIFHMSRCGSTLVAQMLAALPDTILVSEAPPLDAIVMLAARSDWTEARRIAALRAMVGALGRPRAGESRYLVKLNASHALALLLFRRAFPDVPWLFLYREPAQVLASQMAHRGAELAPQFVPSGYYGIEDGIALPALDYGARVLARICAAAIEHRGRSGGLFVNYDALPEAVFSLVLPHFGIVRGAAEQAAMAAVTARDAKAPERPFERARPAIPEKAREAADRHLASVYRRLEAIARRA